MSEIALKKTTKDATKSVSSQSSVRSISSKESNSQVKKQISLDSFFQSKNPKTQKVESKSQGINKEVGGQGSWESASIIKLASWNINGLRAVLKRGELQDYMTQNNLDVLCLNETKIDEESFIKEKIADKIPKGFYQYWNFCIPPIKGYSGVAVLSKEKAISVKQGIDVEEHSQEGRVLTVEFKEFYLVVVYVPNSGSNLNRLEYRVDSFDADFQKYLNNLKKIKNVVLCGDLNVAHKEIDLTNPASNTQTPGFTKEERQSFDKFLKQGWVDTFRFLYPNKIKYSWWSVRTGARAKNIGWRIDYFVVNEQYKSSVQDSFINNDIVGSDHCPVEMLLKLGEFNKQETVIEQNAEEQKVEEKNTKEESKEI